MVHNLKSIFAICLLISSSFTVADEIRHITPPNLDDAHLGRKILCYRPMRHGAPNMSVEKIGDKIIANNYGHGGSGWTLGPGTAEYVDDLMVNSPETKNMQKDTPITVIGAGIIGLYTAYDLTDRGYTNVTVVASKFEDLASNNAGGLLAPVSMDNSSEHQELITKVGIDAYEFYKEIATGKNPHFKNAAVIIPTYFEDREHSGLEPYVGQVMQPAKDVTVDFGNGTTRKMVVYDDGIFINSAKMMADLTKYLKSRNVKFVNKTVTSFSDIKDKYIFNCTGLGAVILNKDSKMSSVQGHLIMLKNQKPKDLQYMILVYFGDDKTKNEQKITRSFYIFPKHFPNTPANDVGVIGGTFIEGGTTATPNYEEFDILVKNARMFYGIK